MCTTSPPTPQCMPRLITPFPMGRSHTPPGFVYSNTPQFYLLSRILGIVLPGGVSTSMLCRRVGIDGQWRATRGCAVVWSAYLLQLAPQTEGKRIAQDASIHRVDTATIDSTREAAAARPTRNHRPKVYKEHTPRLDSHVSAFLSAGCHHRSSQPVQRQL